MRAAIVALLVLASIISDQHWPMFCIPPDLTGIQGELIPVWENPIWVELGNLPIVGEPRHFGQAIVEMTDQENITVHTIAWDGAPGPDFPIGNWSGDWFIDLIHHDDPERSIEIRLFGHQCGNKLWIAITSIP